MKTYIAIKKSAFLATAGLSISPDTAKKRAFLRDLGETVPSQGKKLLQKSGLSEIGIQDSLAAPRHSAFSILTHLGAYIIHASEKKLQSARELLGEDYDLVPDIKLSLPSPAITGSELHTSSILQHQWSPESNIGAAHQSSVKGKNVIIAVLDTGCDADHIQFSQTRIDFRYFPLSQFQIPRAVRGFDPNGHGTHVCGIIAGKSLGVAPEAELMVASVIESEKTSTSLMRIVAALEWVVTKASEPANENKAVILNCSLGFKPRDVNDGSEKIFLSSLRELLVQLSEGFDVLPIVAIGNEGPNTFRYPGAFPEVLSVGAVDYNGIPWGRSGGGSVTIDNQTLKLPDVVGYGVQVNSSFERNSLGHSRYTKLDGTSMATPYVSGVAALMAQQHNLQGVQLRHKLIQDGISNSLPKGPCRSRISALSVKPWL